ncbi:hypothetical protein O6P43_024894 [Quillaja saponaria]|uniref:Uncharacterized protein n=1 Tax=Quillaja saponaria TaxID=32244 RepID=A0AAD7L813_QUISA|nr:hypothetical protein O6P43_024894 [Quillaja saponaria]
MEDETEPPMTDILAVTGGSDFNIKRTKTPNHPGWLRRQVAQKSTANASVEQPAKVLLYVKKLFGTTQFPISKSYSTISCAVCYTTIFQF